MKHIKMILAAMAISCLGVASAQAQEETQDSYWFVGVQGGAQLTPTNFDAVELITPTVGIQAGRYFCPEFGMRLSLNGVWNRSGLKSINDTYDYKYLTSDVDMLFNLTNIFSKKPHKLNTIFVAGLGLTTAWDNDDLEGLTYAEKNVSPWGDNLLTHNFRLGAILDYSISDHWGINFEVDANNLGDKYNSKLNTHCDWQYTAMVGLNFKFGGKKSVKPAPAPVVKEEPAPTPVVEEPAKEPEPAPVVEEKKPEPKPEPTPVVAPRTPEDRTVDIFFELAKANIGTAEDAKLKNLAAWAKDRKVVVTVKGYADKGTGNADINSRLAKERAEGVANELVNKYGFKKSAIETSSYGDTVQPYAENDKNRLVRVEVKEVL